MRAPTRRAALVTFADKLKAALEVERSELLAQLPQARGRQRATIRENIAASDRLLARLAAAG